MVAKTWRVVASATMLVLCAQFAAPILAFAQPAPPPSSTVPAHTSVTAASPSHVIGTTSTLSAAAPTAHTTAPPPTPAATPALATIIQNAITHTTSEVIDISKLSTPGTLSFGSSNFQNTGQLYFVSTNPNYSTATLSAGNIYNAPGAVISTNVPNGLLTGFTGTLAHLNLVLNAANNIWNAGAITSSGHLTAMAPNAMVNALPSAVTGTAPVMQALNNLNLQSPNVTNAGSLISQSGNIAFSTAGAQT